jgi:hypothetical protein
MAIRKLFTSVHDEDTVLEATVLDNNVIEIGSYFMATQQSAGFIVLTPQDAIELADHIKKLAVQAIEATNG